MLYGRNGKPFGSRSHRHRAGARTVTALEPERRDGRGADRSR